MQSLVTTHNAGGEFIYISRVIVILMKCVKLKYNSPILACEEDTMLILQSEERIHASWMKSVWQKCEVRRNICMNFDSPLLRDITTILSQYCGNAINQWKPVIVANMTVFASYAFLLLSFLARSSHGRPDEFSKMNVSKKVLLDEFGKTLLASYHSALLGLSNRSTLQNGSSTRNDHCATDLANIGIDPFKLLECKYKNCKSYVVAIIVSITVMNPVVAICDFENVCNTQNANDGYE